VGLFVIVVLTVLGLVHYYLWRRLVRNTTQTRTSRRIGTAIIVALSVLVVLTFVGSRVFPYPVAVALSWPGYLWVAIMFYLIVGLLVLEIPALAARIVLRRRAAVALAEPVREFARVGAGPNAPSPATPSLSAPPATDTESAPPQTPSGRSGVDQSRRVFLARTVAVTAGVAAVGLTGSGVRTALGAPQLKRIQVPLAKLPRSADGLRIALVSDIHLGPLRGYSHSRRVVDMINEQNADVVAIVGDLVDGSVEELGRRSPLRDLRSRLGSYFVTGNHEYFSGYREWVARVANLGVRPLRNERVEWPGSTSPASTTSPARASATRRTSSRRWPGGIRRAVVMLAHQPVQAAASAAAGSTCCYRAYHGVDRPFGLIVRARPAGDQRAGRGRRNAGVCDQRRGLLGPAGPCRRSPGHHCGGAPHGVTSARRS
jgi:hypothetical protein